MNAKQWYQRLPCSKSATQCKCVCKRWFDLINPNFNSVYFVRRFTRRKIDQNMNEPLGLIHTFSQIGIENIPTKITVPFNEHRPFFRSSFSLSFLPCEEPEKISILTSSSIGLLVCCPGIYDHSVYFICNPLTKQWLSLPPPPLSSQRASSFKNTYKGLTRVAFTHDNYDCDDNSDGDSNFRFNFVHKFRLVCVPARSEDIGEEGFVSEIVVEVFSSETWEWSSSVVQRQDHPCNFVLPCAHHLVAACNGIVHWSDGNLIAFNPWCNAYHFLPKPPVIHDCIGQCQRRLRVANFLHYICEKGSCLQVWDLVDYSNGKWLMAHEVYLKDLTCAPEDSWLMEYAKSTSMTISKSCVLAFSPNNMDIVYLKCLNCVVMCDMPRRVWKVVGEIGHWEERRLHLIFPFVLPWWPTPVPMLPEFRREKLPDIPWRVECVETHKLREEQKVEVSK